MLVTRYMVNAFIIECLKSYGITEWIFYIEKSAEKLCILFYHEGQNLYEIFYSMVTLSHIF